MVRPLNVTGDSISHICYWLHGPFTIWEGGQKYDFEESLIGPSNELNLGYEQV